MADDQPLRDLNASGLYSHAAEMASQLPQERGSPQQMAGVLTNKYGVKPVEMEGFDEAFAGQPSVTRDQLVQHFTSNMPQIERKVLGGSEELYPDSEPTKFSKYALPGGENYREVLLKMPESSPQLDAIYNRMEPFINTPNGTSSPEFQTLRKQYNALTPTFKSSHYPDLNILVHTRLSDRTGPNNEKILHIEEIQSDWAQKGRKVGFADKSENWAQKYADFQKQAVADWIEKKTHDVFEQNPALFGSLDKSREMAQLAAKHYGMAGIAKDLGLSDVHENLYKKMDQFRNGVPSAPYVTNTAAWTDLALKDILNEAVNGGYDKVVWTPGAEQAKRYSLSHHIDEVQYSPGRNGTFSVEAYKGDNNVFNKPNATAEEIANTFGREIAEKITSGHGEANLNTGYNVLSGLDLQTGGEGMKGYYDKIVPTQLSKLLKKLDPEAKIEKGRLPVSDRNKSAPDIARELGMTVDQINALPDAEKRALIGSVRNTISAPSITITPKMREALKRGLPAYADGGAVDDEDEGLTAYHGSPHDFEQFDTGKIGTGEGAQAYGHGLYFAENEPVAQEYRDRLTDKTTNFRVGDIDMPKWILRSIETAEDKNAAIKKHRQDFSGRLAEAETERETSSQPWMVSGRISTAKDILAGLDQIQQGAPAPHTKGRMYEVRINAHPDHFLDWDRPLNEQSDYVKNAISTMQKAGKYVARTEEAPFRPEIEDNPRGRQLVSGLVDGLSGRKEASQHLSDFGIKGIRYLDADSRKDTDQPTRNYVVFNHDHVQVKRKYAQGGAIAET